MSRRAAPTATPPGAPTRLHHVLMAGVSRRKGIMRMPESAKTAMMAERPAVMPRTMDRQWFRSLRKTERYERPDSSREGWLQWFEKLVYIFENMRGDVAQEVLPYLNSWKRSLLDFPPNEKLFDYDIAYMTTEVTNMVDAVQKEFGFQDDDEPSSDFIEEATAEDRRLRILALRRQPTWESNAPQDADREMQQLKFADDGEAREIDYR
jgi:hypothetical protein